MGQQEVLNFLNKNKSHWFKSKQVAQALKQNMGCTTVSLSKLSRHGFIKRKIVKGNNYFYKAM